MAMILLVLVLRCNNSVWQKNISLRLAKDNVFSLIEKSQNNRRIQCDLIKLVSLMTSQMEGSAFMQKSCKKKTKNEKWIIWAFSASSSQPPPINSLRCWLVRELYTSEKILENYKCISKNFIYYRLQIF